MEGGYIIKHMYIQVESCLLRAAVGFEKLEQHSSAEAEDHAEDEGGNEKVQEVDEYSHHAPSGRDATRRAAVALHAPWSRRRHLKRKRQMSEVSVRVKREGKKYALVEQASATALICILWVNKISRGIDLKYDLLYFIVSLCTSQIWEYYQLSRMGDKSNEIDVVVLSSDKIFEELSHKLSGEQLN